MPSQLEPYETSAHKATAARTCARTKKPRYCEFQHMRPWCMERAREITAMLQAPAAVEPPRCPPPAALMRTAERPGLVFCCPSLHIAAESCRSGSHGGRVYRDGETPPPNPDA